MSGADQETIQSPGGDWTGRDLGRYRVTQQLGRGGFGVVYRARDSKLNREVVVKVPHFQLLAVPGFVARFAREIRSLVELEHPRICPILDADEHQGVPYAVVRYLAGGSLQDRRPKDREGRSRPAPLDQVLAWLMPVAEALDFVHQQRYVHRDVKPANILFDAHGNVYLSDFGIAKALAEAESLQSGTLTETGAWIGTPAYMAHEVFAGKEHLPAADQYALAVVAYELLAGRRPYEGPPSAILLSQVTQSPPSLHELVATVPLRIAEVVHRALSNDPQDRYASCRELLQAIEAGQRPGPSRLPPSPQPAAPGGECPETLTAPIGTSPRAERRTSNSIGLKLVLIPAGEFLMGSPDSDKTAYDEERPQHRVRITRPFYLGACPITQAEYERVMGANPSDFKGDPHRPVEQVSWEDAQEFCRRLSAFAEEAAAGRVYRLPTEAQWEYACRAGATTRWCFGDDESHAVDYAWLTSNSGNQTHPVGQKKPNAWGLLDMHGNVWEWCEDWHSPYGESAADDPKGPPQGSRRVIRGGAWSFAAWYCRSAFRRGAHPGDRNFLMGFRITMATDDHR